MTTVKTNDKVKEPSNENKDGEIWTDKCSDYGEERRMENNQS
jgi:hypothetical protein